MVDYINVFIYIKNSPQTKKNLPSAMFEGRPIDSRDITIYYRGIHVGEK